MPTRKQLNYLQIEDSILGLTPQQTYCNDKDSKSLEEHAKESNANNPVKFTGENIGMTTYNPETGEQQFIPKDNYQK